MSATRAFVAAPVAAKLSASRKSATGKPYKAGARRSVAVCAKTSAPELDINTKVFEKELVDVAGEEQVGVLLAQVEHRLGLGGLSHLVERRDARAHDAHVF